MNSGCYRKDKSVSYVTSDEKLVYLIKDQYPIFIDYLFDYDSQIEIHDYDSTTAVTQIQIENMVSRELLNLLMKNGEITKKDLAKNTKRESQAMIFDIISNNEDKHSFWLL